MKPTIGRIVHFVIPKEIPQGEDRPDKIVAGEERPAMTVRTWGGDCVNLHVFADGANDHNTVLAGGGWITSVVYDEDKGPRTWHWPEREQEIQPIPTSDTPRRELSKFTYSPFDTTADVPAEAVPEGPADVTTDGQR